MWRMAMPNAVPPIPYAIPRVNVSNMALRGAERKTSANWGMVIQAPMIGAMNQQIDAWASQYVCQDHPRSFCCGV